jgi:hypothetical protein
MPKRNRSNLASFEGIGRREGKTERHFIQGGDSNEHGTLHTAFRMESRQTGCFKGSTYMLDN